MLALFVAQGLEAEVDGLLHGKLAHGAQVEAVRARLESHGWSHGRALAVSLTILKK